MKVGLCLAGQLSNLTKNEKKTIVNGKQSGKKKTPAKVLMLL